jgi:hypothetical protein
LDLYYSVSRVLLRPLGGVIFISVGCFITLFTLCPFVTKRGSNFYFGLGMYFQTGQVIFVPEWPKGEFVSILALFCVWTKLLMCNDAVNRDSTFRVMSEDSAYKSEEFQVPCQPSGRCVIPSGRPSVCCSIRPDDVSFRLDIRQTCIIRPDYVFLPSGHLHRIEKLLSQFTLSGRFGNTSGRLLVLERFTDSFQVQEREDQSTVQTMWYPVRMHISVRQESQFKMNRPDI